MHHTGIKTLEAGFTLGLQPGFQLHHTGIKTASTVAAAVEVVDFNCTIQELKPASRRAQRLPFQFQLHHTGIKTDKRIDEVLVSSVFQLHHTGIKTRSLHLQRRLRVSFQLHHTGIKTCLPAANGPLWGLFQLHHTGIKTQAVLCPDLLTDVISIAPYRN